MCAKDRCWCAWRTTNIRRSCCRRKGQLANLQARLDEALHGSRPEEVAQAQANLDSAKADLADAKVTLDRTKELIRENLTPKQSLDDAQSRYDGAITK